MEWNRQNLSTFHNLIPNTEDVELTTAYIGQVERGERNLTRENLIKVANRLGVSVDYLLSDSIDAARDTAMIQMAQLLNGRPLREKELAISLIKTLFSHLDREKNEAESSAYDPKT